MAKLKNQAAQLGIVTARLKSAEEKDTALASQQA